MVIQHDQCGGVGLYIKNTIKFELNQYSNYLLPNSEHLWIDIHAKTGPIVVGVVYRYPIATASAVDNFKDCLNEIFTSLNNSKKQYYCFGDFNINLMQISTNDSIRRYANILLVLLPGKLFIISGMIIAKKKAFLVMKEKNWLCFLIWQVLLKKLLEFSKRLT